MSRILLDLAELLARVENDRQLMRELMLIFKKEFPRHSQVLREAVASKNANEVASATHTLKGMLSNMAAAEAAEAAANLERLGRSGKVEKLEGSLANFESVAEELSRQLDSYLAEVSA